MDKEPYFAPGELKPCPFCGGEPDVSQGTQANNAPWWYIECTTCGASCESGTLHDLREAAIEECVSLVQQERDNALYIDPLRVQGHICNRLVNAMRKLKASPPPQKGS